MKLHAVIGDYTADVEIRREGGRVLARVDDRSYELDVHESAYGALISSDGRVFDCRLNGQPASGETVDVVVGTDHFAVTLTDPKRLRGAASAGALADGVARIVAPMPGKVVRVLVEPGAIVEAGAGLIVVEAMKMQNEMKSPKAGTVVALNVSVGATVNGGDVLAVIE